MRCVQMIAEMRAMIDENNKRIANITQEMNRLKKPSEKKNQFM